MDAETQITLDHIQNDISELKKSVQQIDHVLRGNGQPGLRTRVEKLEMSAKRNSGLVNVIISIIAAAAAIIAALK